MVSVPSALKELNLHLMDQAAPTVDPMKYYQTVSVFVNKDMLTTQLESVLSAVASPTVSLSKDSAQSVLEA